MFNAPKELEDNIKNGKWNRYSEDCDKWVKKNPYEANPVCGFCSKCGIELRQVMGYVCIVPECPIFIQITC